MTAVSVPTLVAVNRVLLDIAGTNMLEHEYTFFSNSSFRTLSRVQAKYKRLIAMDCRLMCLLRCIINIVAVAIMMIMLIDIMIAKGWDIVLRIPGLGTAAHLRYL